MYFRQRDVTTLELLKTCVLSLQLLEGDLGLNYTFETRS